MAMKYKIEYISTFHTDVLNVMEFLAEYPNKAARSCLRYSQMSSVTLTIFIKIAQSRTSPAAEGERSSPIENTTVQQP